MSEPTPPAEKRAWLALLASVVLTIGAGVYLGHLLWQVPEMAERFVDTGATLPRPTLYVLAASNWFIRLFPFAVILAMLVGPWLVTLFFASAVRLSPRRVAGWTAVLVGTVALVEVAACVGVLYGMRLGNAAIGQARPTAERGK